MMTMQAVKMVQRGSTCLDTQRPGWHRRIDLETLEMSSPERCILGQEFGTCSEGKVALGIEMGRDYGFTLPTSSYWLDAHVAWKQLQELWVEEIEARRLCDEVDAGVSSEADEAVLV